MKNYNVKAIKRFDDALENVPRKVNDTFKCDKKRYLILKENNVVELIGIDKEKKKLNQK